MAGRRRAASLRIDRDSGRIQRTFNAIKRGQSPLYCVLGRLRSAEEAPLLLKDPTLILVPGGSIAGPSLISGHLPTGDRAQSRIQARHLPVTVAAPGRDPLSPLVIGKKAAGDEGRYNRADNVLHGLSSRLSPDWPSLFACPYLPTTSTTKLPGIIGGRGRGFSAVGAGLGPKSAVTRYTRSEPAS